MFANATKIASFVIANGGSKYVVGDKCFYPTDSPQDFSSGWFQVSSVDGNGAVTGLIVLDYGGWLNPQSNPAKLIGGNGTDLQLTITYTIYWQNVPWIVPTSAGLEYLLSVVVQNPVSTLSDQSSRSDQVVRLAVQKVRGAIAVARRTPLSVTALSVPPEAEAHVYALSLQMLIGSNPNLAKYAISEAGSSKPALALMIDEADAWVKSVREGRAVEYPSDPDPTFKTAVREGAMSMEEDLSTFSAPNYPSPPQSWLGIGQP
jgi:hypothetical protein